MSIPFWGQRNHTALQRAQINSNNNKRKCSDLGITFHFLEWSECHATSHLCLYLALEGFQMEV